MTTSTHSKKNYNPSPIEMLTASGKKVDDTLVYTFLVALILIVGMICYALLYVY